MTRLSVRAFTRLKGLPASDGIRAEMQAAGTPRMRTWLNTDTAAAEIFWLGHGLVPLIQNGSTSAKYTMVVVGDGFGPDDTDDWRRIVDDLLLDPSSGLFEEDFFVRNERAFNVLRLDLVSVDSGVSTETYAPNGTPIPQTVQDTALDYIYSGDWNHCWLRGGPLTEERLAKALSIWAPEHHIVLAVLNNPGGGGCGSLGRAAVGAGVDWATVAHEMGHSIGGLGDEYCGATAYTGDEPGAINITKETDRTKLKWASFVLDSTPIPTGTNTSAGGCADYNVDTKPPGWDDNVDVGLFEGATVSQTKYGSGLYRPVVSCRMRDNDPPFCPVCTKAMDAIVAPYFGSARAGATGGRAVPGDGYVRMTVRFEDGALRITEARRLEGLLPAIDTVAVGFAHEVLVDGHRVALGSMPSAGVHRSMNSPSIGPREHHYYETDSFDFVVRVPEADLRGRDLTAMEVNLLKVQSSRYEPMRGQTLRGEPDIDAEVVATLRPRGIEDLPSALRQAATPRS